MTPSTAGSKASGGTVENAKRAARTYLRQGWAVIPIRPGGKEPMVRWQPFQRRRPVESEIEWWFDRWPDANLAVVTGTVSGLVVLDVDPRHDGDASLRLLEERYGKLPPTPVVITGGGGRHFYFALPRDGAGPAVPSRVGLEPGLDLRAEGGLVVVPPSLHASGRRYRWLTADDPGRPLAPLPEWLERLARHPESGAGRSLAYWRRLAAEGIEEGQRNTTIASFAGYLLCHGVDPRVVLELLLCWNRMRCHPPLDDAEVERTVTSVLRTRKRREGGGEA